MQQHATQATASAGALLLGLTLLGCSSAQPISPPLPTSAQSNEAIAIVLNDFHRAASEPDEERYFGHFAPHGVFIGTDPAERWTVAQFRAYAHKHFSTGKGWTYLPSQRHINLADNGNAAWFDEVVTSEKYGACRGTGALVYRAGAWKIAQYSLSLPLPNDIFRDVAEKVKAFDAP